MDARMKKASKAIIALFQDNYPEMLSSKLFLSVPRVMEVIFNLMSSFSDPATRRKFRMVSPGNSRAALLEFIRPDQLPPSYGGFDAAASAGPDDGPCKSTSGELKLKAGVAEEVTVDLPRGGAVAWNYVTRRDAAAVQATIHPPSAAGGAARVVADGAAAEDGAAGVRLVVRERDPGRGCACLFEGPDFRRRRDRLCGGRDVRRGCEGLFGVRDVRRGRD